MCSEISDGTSQIDSNPTVEDKVDALKESLKKDNIITTNKGGLEVVSSKDEPSIMGSKLREFILSDEDGPEILNKIIKDYPDLRNHWIDAYQDMGIEKSDMSQDTIKALLTRS